MQQKHYSLSRANNKRRKTSRGRTTLKHLPPSVITNSKTTKTNRSERRANNDELVKASFVIHLEVTDPKRLLRLVALASFPVLVLNLMLSLTQKICIVLRDDDCMWMFWPQSGLCPCKSLLIQGSCIGHLSLEGV